MTIYGLKLKHLVLLLFIFFSSNYVFANGTCENFFGDIRSLSLSEFEKNEVHTVEYYISKVLKNQKPGITPDFIMPLKEKLKSKLWTGETPKRFFKQTLPKYFKAIDHQLLEAQPGMVKVVKYLWFKH